MATIASRLRQVMLEMTGIDQLVFTGYVDALHPTPADNNGWVRPWFSFTAMVSLLQIMEVRQHSWRYDSRSDSFTVWRVDSGARQITKGTMQLMVGERIDGLLLYKTPELWPWWIHPVVSVPTGLEAFAHGR